MHCFEVHSNESACRKKVRLGLEQVYTCKRKRKKQKRKSTQEIMRGSEKIRRQGQR